MLSDDDLSYYREALRAPEVASCLTALQVLAADPPADARLVPLVEPLLGDERLGLLGLPCAYGEVRWLAARTLAGLRRRCGDPRPVAVHGVLIPLDGDALWGLCQEHAAPLQGLPSPGGVEGALARLEQLRRAGVSLPRRDVRLPGAAP